MSAEAAEGRLELVSSSVMVSFRSRLSLRKDGGRFLPRHTMGVDPDLVGEKAFDHPAVKSWRRWLLEDYTPNASWSIVTPCSNVKPYTVSPVSRKIRAILRRNGLWDFSKNVPKGVTWLYFSDLLIFVPYEKAEEYPACCYEVPPDLVISKPKLYATVTSLLEEALEALYRRGLRLVVTSNRIAITVICFHLKT
jgi:hypothetical protein